MSTPLRKAVNPFTKAIDPYESLGVGPAQHGPTPATPAQSAEASPVAATAPAAATAPSAPRTSPIAVPPEDKMRRSERIQINVTRRTKLLLEAEHIERRKRGLKPRQSDETTLIEEAVEKVYGHLWTDYASILDTTHRP